MKAEITNAIIADATMTIGERGVLEINLNLDYGSSGQMFAGYALYLPKSFDNHAINGPAGHYAFRCMEVAGVTDFSKLVGRPVRVDSDFNRVHGIGHIIKDDWFYPADDLQNKEKQ